MKKVIVFSALSVFLFICGCAGGHNLRIEQKESLESRGCLECFSCRNISLIKGVKPGMSKTEVLSLLGRERVNVDTMVITNPYKSQTARDREVIYYYTGAETGAGPVSEQDLIPLIFEKGILVGVGYCDREKNEPAE